MASFNLKFDQQFLDYRQKLFPVTILKDCHRVIREKGLWDFMKFSESFRPWPLTQMRLMRVGHQEVFYNFDEFCSQWPLVVF